MKPLKTFLNFFLLFLLVFILTGVPGCNQPDKDDKPDPEEEEGCASNDTCGSDYYCHKEMGDCDGTGECAEKPEFCNSVEDYVCGCDGHTYLNPCQAAQAGVSVNYSGECVGR
ncbi:MAG: hypothetical protein JXB88_20680 [Spirochaetales bacterium]|nr:hypothetical protein [Spirochaetales bacterium]